VNVYLTVHLTVDARRTEPSPCWSRKLRSSPRRGL